jgi:hypothetical protein
MIRNYLIRTLAAVAVALTLTLSPFASSAHAASSRPNALYWVYVLCKPSGCADALLDVNWRNVPGHELYTSEWRGFTYEDTTHYTWTLAGVTG